MKRFQYFLVSITTLLLCTGQPRAIAQSQPQSQPPSQPQSQPAENWFTQLKGTYAGEIWHNGKVQSASTTFGYFNDNGGIFALRDNNMVIVGDILQCNVKAERTVQCQWSEGGKTGALEATFSQDLSSFKGYKVEPGSTEQHPWNGSKDK